MFKKLTLGLLGFVVLLAAVGLLLPPKWHVERTITVQATPQTLHGLMIDLKQWEKWVAWNNEMDPEAKWTFTDPAQGVGATMTWEGPKLGSGKLTLVESNPLQGVRYEMMMEGNTPAKGGFTMTSEANATRVTWVDEGDFGKNVAGRWFRPLLEKMLGAHFEKGLVKLKALAEKAEADAAAPAVPAVVPEAAAAAEVVAPEVAAPAAP